MFQIVELMLMFIMDYIVPYYTVLHCYKEKHFFIAGGEDELRRSTYIIKNNTFEPNSVALEVDSDETDLIPPSDEDMYAEEPLLQQQQEPARRFHIYFNIIFQLLVVLIIL